MPEIRTYDYVNHPYRVVRDILRADAHGVLRTATVAAASRAEEVAAKLAIEIGGLQIGAEIATSVGEIEESTTGNSPVTRIPITWEAARRPRFFPLMSAVLSVYPLTPTETQLDFVGDYAPPLGALGSVVDAIVGHRIAEASVARFVSDVAHYLRRSLPH